MFVRVVHPLNATTVAFSICAAHAIACAPAAARSFAALKLKSVPKLAIWVRVWIEEFMLEGLISWVKILCAPWMLAVVVFAKAVNPSAPTLALQEGIAVTNENMPLWLLTHVEKLLINCGMAFPILLEAFTMTWLVFRIVWFRTETPAMNSATVKRKTEIS